MKTSPLATTIRDALPSIFFFFIYRIVILRLFAGQSSNFIVNFYT
jgi:hypothetical protein